MGNAVKGGSAYEDGQKVMKLLARAKTSLKRRGIFIKSSSKEHREIYTTTRFESTTPPCKAINIGYGVACIACLGRGDACRCG